MQDLLAQTLSSPTPPGGGSLVEFIRIILGTVTKLAIPVLAVLVVYWGFRIVASLGNDKEIAAARHRLKWALIIAAVFLGLSAIFSLLFNTGESIGIVGALLVAIALIFIWRATR